MRIGVLAAAALLAGCGGGGGEAPRPSFANPVPVPAAAPAPASLAAVQGRSASALIAQFGQPHLDLSEGRARKLQFAGPICVLDAYLYPQRRGEPVVTHIDTRQRDGSPIDPASCVSALMARH